MRKYSVTAKQKSFQAVSRALGKSYKIFVGHDMSLKAIVEHLTFTSWFKANVAKIAFKQKASTLKKEVSMRGADGFCIDVRPPRLLTNIDLFAESSAISLKEKDTRILEMRYFSPSEEKIVLTEFAPEVARLKCLRISDISVDNNGNDNLLSNISERTLSNISFVEY